MHFDYILENFSENEFETIKLLANTRNIPRKYDSVVRNFIKRGLFVESNREISLFSSVFKDYFIQKYFRNSKSLVRRFFRRK